MPVNTPTRKGIFARRILENSHGVNDCNRSKVCLESRNSDKPYGSDFSAGGAPEQGRVKAAETQVDT